MNLNGTCEYYIRRCLWITIHLKREKRR